MVTQKNLDRRGLYPLPLCRSRRKFIDQRRTRPAGEDSRIQGRRGAGVPREGG